MAEALKKIYFGWVQIIEDLRKIENGRSLGRNTVEGQNLNPTLIVLSLGNRMEL